MSAAAQSLIEDVWQSVEICVERIDIRGFEFERIQFAPAQYGVSLESDDEAIVPRSLAGRVRSLRAYRAIRNPGMHESAGDVSQQQALEQLAAFSILARRVDQATLTTEDGSIKTSQN